MAAPSTCPPGGWRRSTPATPRRRRRLRGRSSTTPKWCTEFGESGFATPTWPAEYGAGLSLRPGQARPVNEVLNQYRVPRPGNIIGIGMGGPTVIAWGSEELKQQFLRGIATNEEIWCQLFSEPGAGSDVAGLATRAERDGDEWVVNGQKVWTSLAHLARYGMLLARTDPDQPKHKGLTYFVVDMHQPGVEVRPLRADHRRRRVQRGVLRERARPRRVAARAGRRGLAGRHHHADERAGVAVGARVGERRHHRRQPGAAGHRPAPRRSTDPVPAPAAGRGVDRPPAHRGSTTSAPPTGAVAARRPGPRARSPSCSSAEFNQRLQKLAVDLEGVDGIAWEGKGLTGEATFSFVGGTADDPRTVARGFLRAQANTIEGGTSAIMRNILGERVLGLPKEPDASRDVPWKDVPRSVSRSS